MGMWLVAVEVLLYLLKRLIEKGEENIPITDFRMTRFWITLEQGVELVFKALEEAKVRNLYFKIPSLE